MKTMMDEGKEENQARWKRMEEIYHAALPLVAIERQAFVAQHCADDAALQAEVISLLAADNAAATFLQEPIVELVLAVLADERLLRTEMMAQPAASPASADLTGMRVADRYEVTERLGGGGFGDVYKAADTKVMSRPVVIKVLREDVLREEEAAKRDWTLTKFQQEIEALAKIQDPGVVGIFDADTLPNGSPYIVMEFVEGSDLRHFIKQARQESIMAQGLKFHDVAEIVKQGGRTLTAAHDKNIIHRDLKPENIMLRQSTSGDLQVKVIDFGIAKVRNSLIAPSTKEVPFVGTWQYMSPEQLQLKKVTAASDIYALGVITYELLTGRYPFAAKDPVQLRDLQEGGVKVKPRDLNPDLSAAAQEAILKALSYYPAERHKRARDFGDELARALAAEDELVQPVPLAHIDSGSPTLKKADEIAPAGREEPISAQPQSTTVQASWLGSRKRWLFAATAVLLVGLISFVAWRAFRTSEPQQLQGPAEATPSLAPERTLTYWLTVQRKHDRESFPSIGEKIFDAGSKFWLNFQITQAGALYLFSEGKNENDVTEWNTMFPTPANNNGDAWLPPGITLRTEGYVFDDQRGMMKVWLVWAEQRIQALDEIVKKSLDRPSPTRGVISEPNQLQSFIEQHRAPQPEITLDKKKFQITLKGRSNILVDLRELEYQP
jgi:serine/threonine protein kinase